MDRKVKHGAKGVGDSRSAIASATWLTKCCLLLVGDFESLELAETVSVSLASSSARATTDCLSKTSARIDGRCLLAVVLPSSEVRTDASLLLTLSWRGASVDLSAEEVHALATDPDLLIRETLAPLDHQSREDVVAFLGSIMTVAPETERAELSVSLLEFREALRERLPALVNAPERPLGAHIDRLMSVDAESFYVEGWLRSKDDDVVRLSAVAPEGHRAELIDRLFRCGRSDVSEFYALNDGASKDKLGFVCFFETSAPSVSGSGWIFEVEDSQGRSFELEAPAVVADPLEVRQTVLGGPSLDGLPDDELMSRHIHPVVTRIQSRVGVEPVVHSLVEYGTPPDAPDVSIVVPLYLHIDHLEAQLAEFAADPALLECDLVYVLDSPQQAEELANRAADLQPIYQVPFRVAFLERNTGFAGACNAGADVARGRLLLLLNSDVLPDRPGWLEMMRDFYDATADIGALGVKLLYEDDSIQHAGMYYQRLVGSPLWVDGHYFKGMHRSLPGANISRKVPLVSGACMMVDADLYKRVGGLPTIYVQGDYEDSDFCLRLTEEGLDNWYIADAELYHLEGQSYAPDVRRPFNRYNMWLHNYLRRAAIAALADSTST
jgi:O-antigen biosynthesis protein